MSVIFYLYTSSNGLVSEKHESQTSLTVLTACTSSLTHGLAIIDCTARRLTQSWNCSVTRQLLRVQNSLVNLHSPLNIDARICYFGRVLLASKHSPFSSPTQGQVFRVDRQKHLPLYKRPASNSSPLENPRQTANNHTHAPSHAPTHPPNAPDSSPHSHKSKSHAPVQTHHSASPLCPPPSTARGNADKAHWTHQDDGRG